MDTNNHPILDTTSIDQQLHSSQSSRRAIDNKHFIDNTLKSRHCKQNDIIFAAISDYLPVLRRSPHPRCRGFSRALHVLDLALRVLVRRNPCAFDPTGSL